MRLGVRRLLRVFERLPAYHDLDRPPSVQYLTRVMVRLLEQVEADGQDLKRCRARAAGLRELFAEMGVGGAAPAAPLGAPGCCPVM